MLAKKEKLLQDKKNFSAPLPNARHLFIVIMTAHIKPFASRTSYFVLYQYVVKLRQVFTHRLKLYVHCLTTYAISQTLLLEILQFLISIYVIWLIPGNNKVTHARAFHEQCILSLLCLIYRLIILHSNKEINV